MRLSYSVMMEASPILRMRVVVTTAAEKVLNDGKNFWPPAKERRAGRAREHEQGQRESGARALREQEAGPRESSGRQP